MSEAVPYEVATLAELAEKFGESPDYWDVMGYALELEGRELGTAAEHREFSIPLGGADVNVLSRDGVLRVVEFIDREETFYVFIEADHRGPEHGVDAWLGDPDEQVPRVVLDAARVVSHVS